MPGVAVAWVLAQPGISAAIVGASSAGQLDATLAGTSLVLDPEERAVLDDVWYELPRRRPDPGPVR
jgi:aryl-alcohol dehydrogenase-like predicted oxidoreductase